MRENNVQFQAQRADIHTEKGGGEKNKRAKIKTKFQ